MKLSKWKKNRLSTFMSKILRHTPHEFGIVLDEEGYCDVQDLLDAIRTNDSFWSDIVLENIEQVVTECPKTRFELNGNQIRARYAHSIIKISYQQGTPPDVLHHGTHEGTVEIVMKDGIRSMNRKYVHLSETTHFATLSGKRRGNPVLLLVDTKSAQENGVIFYYAGNEVWLADYIPPQFIKGKLEG